MPNQDAFSHLGDASSIWSDWLQTQTIEARNRLLSHYMLWSKKVASNLFVKYRTPGLEWGDCVQFCFLGLVDAVEKFKPEIGVPFEAYAYKFLKGSVLRGARCFMQEKTISSQRSDFLRYSRVVESTESDDSFDVIVDAVVGLAFGNFLELGIVGTEVPNIEGNEYRSTEKDFSEILNGIEQLGEQSKFVIKSHYMHHLSFSEIADIMQLSRPRVSQIHHAALRLIKTIYEENNP